MSKRKPRYTVAPSSSFKRPRSDREVREDADDRRRRSGMPTRDPRWRSMVRDYRDRDRDRDRGGSGGDLRRSGGGSGSGGGRYHTVSSSSSSRGGGRGARRGGDAASSGKFWKPGNVAPGVDIQKDSLSSDQIAAEDSHGGGGAYFVHNPNGNRSLKQQRQILPVYARRREILYAVESHPVTVIVGETGSGKTTQIPQYLDEAGWSTGDRMIACTQPRRIAAVNVAKRVAQEMNAELGLEVGYAIRYDINVDEYRTRIKYMTDGMLLRETMLDPLLSRYSVIMLDEAHERSLHTDVLIGLLKKVMKKRKDLRLVVSSATLDAEFFKNFFETTPDDGSDDKPSTPAPGRTRPSRFGPPVAHVPVKEKPKESAVIVSVEGRQFPVEVHYSQKPVRDYLEAAIETIFAINQHEPQGDILVFLTGEEEINNVVQAVREREGHRYESRTKLRALPLYSALPPLEQAKCFEEPTEGYRKVVVSTNVAETSLTIPGVVYVIDSMFVKLRSFDPETMIESLLVAPVSQASASQRKGRAGRVQPGKCYRLCTEKDFKKLAVHTVPEIQRSNLAPVVLQLKALGIDDILHFEFMSPPPAETMGRALELLFALGALDEYCKLTKPVGSILSEFPVEPRFARMLIASGEMGCAEEMLSIAAMLSVPPVFVSPRGAQAKARKVKRRFSVLEGDHITLLNVFNSFLRQQKNPKWCYDRFLNIRALRNAVKIRKHLRRYLKRFDIRIATCGGDVKVIRRCIVCGFFSNAAQLQPDGSYKTARGHEQLFIHPTSILFREAAEWVIYHDLVQTTKKFMRNLSTIEPTWLAELAPHFYEQKDPRGTAASDGSALAISSSS